MAAYYDNAPSQEIDALAQRVASLERALRPHQDGGYLDDYRRRFDSEVNSEIARLKRERDDARTALAFLVSKVNEDMVCRDWLRCDVAAALAQAGVSPEDVP